MAARGATVPSWLCLKWPPVALLCDFFIQRGSLDWENWLNHGNTNLAERKVFGWPKVTTSATTSVRMTYEVTGVHFEFASEWMRNHPAVVTIIIGAQLSATTATGTHRFIETYPSGKRAEWRPQRRRPNWSTIDLLQLVDGNQSKDNDSIKRIQHMKNDLD